MPRGVRGKMGKSRRSLGLSRLTAPSRQDCHVAYPHAALEFLTCIKNSAAAGKCSIFASGNIPLAAVLLPLLGALRVAASITLYVRSRDTPRRPGSSTREGIPQRRPGTRGLAFKKDHGTFRRPPPIIWPRNGNSAVTTSVQAVGRGSKASDWLLLTYNPERPLRDRRRGSASRVVTARPHPKTAGRISSACKTPNMC